MSKLLIYIPTYNRLEKLTLCVSRLLEELSGLEDLVKIYISDNCSTDGTSSYLESIKHPSIQFRSNPINIGLARNLCFAFELSEESEFTWIIGDDEIVLGGALLHLVNAIRDNSEIDMFFINSIAYDEEDKDRVIEQFFENRFTPKRGSGSCKSSVNSVFKCNFQELLDPNIDEVLLGSLMCYAWRSKLVRNVISDDEISFDFSKPRSCYPHTYNFLHCLKPTTPSMHLSYLATANFWHKGVEWGDKGYELVVTQGLGLTLYEALRLGYIDKDREASFFAHYMKIAAKSFETLLDSPDNDFKERLLDFHPQLSEMLLRDWLLMAKKERRGLGPRLKRRGAKLKRFGSRFFS